MILNLDHLLTVWRWSGSALPEGAASVLWFSKETYSGTPVQACTDLINAWVATLKGEVSSSVTLDGIDYWWGTDGEATSGSVSGGGVGGGAADPDPPQVAYLIHKVGVTGGRHGRGRWYHPGVPAADTNVGGTIGTTAAADMQADLNTFYATITDPTAPGALLPIITQSPYNPAAPHVGVSSFQLDPRVGTIRRRNRR